MGSRLIRFKWLLIPLSAATLSMILVAGCGKVLALDTSPSLTRYGPMAVIDYDGGGVLQARGGQGEVEIDGECVYLRLEHSDDRLLLIWASGRSSWDETDRAVVYDAPGQGRMRIQDGDTIEIGGAAFLPSDPSRVRWLAAPDERCKGRRWGVGEITKLAWDVYGPLAVLADDSLAEPFKKLSMTGAIWMSEHCVALKPDGEGEPSPLIWEPGQVGWDSDKREIILLRAGREVDRIGDEDRAVVSGVTHPGRTGDWLNPVDTQCGGSAPYLRVQHLEKQ